MFLWNALSESQNTRPKRCSSLLPLWPPQKINQVRPFLNVNCPGLETLSPAQLLEEEIPSRSIPVSSFSDLYIILRPLYATSIRPFVVVIPLRPDSPLCPRLIQNGKWFRITSSSMDRGLVLLSGLVLSSWLSTTQLVLHACWRWISMMNDAVGNGTGGMTVLKKNDMDLPTYPSVEWHSLLPNAFQEPSIDLPCAMYKK